MNGDQVLTEPKEPLPPKLHREPTNEEVESLPRWKSYLLLEVDVAAAAPQLALLCLNTGFVDAIAFTACYIWPGFQTGNTVQLGLAIARLFSPGDIPESDRHGFHTADALALCSLIAFVLGTFSSRLNPNFVSYKSRGYIVAQVLLQALLTLAAAITAHYGRQTSFAPDRGNPSWNNALGFATLAFISASMGAQGVLGTKLASPFATTVVLTSVYCNIALDPALFTFTKLVPAREDKFIAVLAALIGGIAARALIGQIGASNTLFIGAGLRFATALMWIIAKAKPPGNKQMSKQNANKM